MKKTLALLLALVMVLGLLAGCGSKDAEPDAPAADETAAAPHVNLPENGVVSDKEFTIRVLCGEATGEGMDVVMDLYAEMYPNATVEIVESTWGPGGADIREKALILINGGDAPDIMKTCGIKEFAGEGLLMDLTEDLKTFPIYPNLTEGQLSRMTYDGKLYGQNQSSNSIFMFYNKDILEAAGWDHAPATMDELLQLGADIEAKDLKTADGKDIFLTELDGGNWDTDYWLWANDGVQMNEDFTETLINSPESVKAYTFMQDLVKNGYAPKPDGTSTNMWANGQLALYFSGDWDLLMSNDAGLNYDTTVCPTGPSGKRTVSIGGPDWGISADCKQKQEALDLLQLLVCKDYVAHGTEQSMRFVTDMTLYDDEELTAVWKQTPHYFEAKMVQREALKDSMFNFLEAPYSYPDAKNIYATALERILINLEDVQTVMDEAAEQINAGLAG